MSLDPILLVGGSGIVGRTTAQYFREANPGIRLLIGGRDLHKASKVAAKIENSEGVALDLKAKNLGLGDRAVSAVAVFPKDDALVTLRFAQDRRVPYIAISSGSSDIGPEVGAYMHRPNASAVVLGAEWLVGALSVPTFELAKEFSRLDSITVGALLDEEDSGGPATQGDMKTLSENPPPALTRREGAFFWREGKDNKAEFRAVDGTLMEAFGLSAYDPISLASATDAPNVQFNLAVGVSSSRRRGEPMSTEIIIELAGEDHSSQPLSTRHAVFHPQGQMPLTGFGVALVLERLLGLDGQPATEPGLYFPYQLLKPSSYLARFEKMGGKIIKLDVI